MKKSSDVQRISKLKIETLFLSWSFLDFWISDSGFVAKNYPRFISIPIFWRLPTKKEDHIYFCYFKKNLQFIYITIISKKKNTQQKQKATESWRIYIKIHLTLTTFSRYHFIPYLKFRYCEETKIGIFFRIFVAFWEYLNFDNLCPRYLIKCMIFYPGQSN